MTSVISAAPKTAATAAAHTISKKIASIKTPLWAIAANIVTKTTTRKGSVSVTSRDTTTLLTETETEAATAATAADMESSTTAPSAESDSKSNRRELTTENTESTE